MFGGQESVLGNFAVKHFERGKMKNNSRYDMVFIGNYTKDTVVSFTGTRVVDGGGFNYGAHAAVLMGLKTAAVTRLSQQDRHVVEVLVRLGVEVFPEYTEHSTHLRLYYPTSNVDERVLTVTQSAGSFRPDQVRDLQARAFLINASFRGEVGLEVIREIKKKPTLLTADAQGFARVVSPDGTMRFDPWPEKQEVLGLIDILKADAVEAEMLTGESDIHAAARTLAGWGPREIVLTHRDGLLVLAEDQYYQAPFRPREMVGRSGRGDTCVASYVARRLSATPKEACTWAAALTSLKMEAEGPIKKQMADVEALLQQAYL